MEDLLIALHRAPHGRSLHGVLRQRADLGVRQQALSARRAAGMILSVSGDAELIGESVLRDSRSLVARSTFAQLMRMAGVDPPAPD